MAAEYLAEHVFFEFEHEGLKMRILDTPIGGRILYEIQFWQNQRLLPSYAEVVPDQRAFLEKAGELVILLERRMRQF